jgi:hypothetical protein
MEAVARLVASISTQRRLLKFTIIITAGQLRVVEIP